MKHLLTKPFKTILKTTLILALPLGIVACEKESPENDSEMMEPTNESHSVNDDQIAIAESAAPVEISGSATILDMEGNILREGTNNWTCIPIPGEPMCADEQWMSWVDAYMNQADEVKVDAVGIAYMLQGDKGTSNIVPYEGEPTADNDWVVTGPHLMLIVPDPALLEGIPTDPLSGGPYVMWPDTPFEHVMIPIYPESVEMPHREE